MNAWGHFKTITSHKFLVMKYCFKVGLYKQGFLHDLSKYSPTEFMVGAKYYQEAPTMQREKPPEYLLPGCITKEETNIILNIG